MQDSSICSTTGYTLFDYPLETVFIQRYLGFTLSEDLKWDPKCITLLAMQDQKDLAYFSLVYSYFEHICFVQDPFL